MWESTRLPFSFSDTRFPNTHNPHRLSSRANLHSLSGSTLSIYTHGYSLGYPRGRRNCERGQLVGVRDAQGRPLTVSGCASTKDRPSSTSSSELPLTTVATATSRFLSQLLAFVFLTGISFSNKAARFYTISTAGIRLLRVPACSVTVFKCL